MKNFIINHKLIFIFLGICFILLVSPKSSYCSVSDDFIVWLESNKTELGTLLEASPNVQDYIIINNAWDNKSVLFYTSGTNNKFYFTHISDSKKLLCCSNDLGNNMYTYYIFNNDGDSNFIMPILDYFEDPYYMTNVIQNWQSDYSNILYNSSTVYYDGTEKVLIEKKKITFSDGDTSTDTGESGNEGKDDDGDTDFSSDYDSVTGELSGIKERFSFYNDVKKNVNDMVNAITDVDSVPKYYLNVSSKWYSGQITIVDLSWYEPYKDLGDNVICIFAYLSFLWNIFIKLPDIIQGAGAGSYAGDMVGDIKAYKATGFGRSSSIKRKGF